MRALIQRVTARKAFLAHGQFDASSQEMREEFDKQLRLLDNATVRAIGIRLQRKDLSTDERAFLTEVIAEQRQFSQNRDDKG